MILSAALILVCSVSLLSITVIAEANDAIPLWIKTTISWWLNGLITDIELFNGIVFLIGNNIIELSELGININMKLRFVNDGMKKYLKRHREKLLQ